MRHANGHRDRRAAATRNVAAVEKTAEVGNFMGHTPKIEGAQASPGATPACHVVRTACNPGNADFGEPGEPGRSSRFRKCDAVAIKLHDFLLYSFV
jgi:hypothetical protein